MYQPKLNLKFVPPITNADELDSIRYGGGPGVLIDHLNSGRLIPVEIYNSSYDITTDLFDSLNESNGEFDFLLNKNLTGLQFKYTETSKIIYTIVNDESTSINSKMTLQWYTEDGQFSETFFRKSKFLKGLNSGYWILFNDFATDEAFINEENVIDYSFLLNSDLIGVQFYNPAEHEDTGCVYTIIEQLTTGHVTFDGYNVEPHIRVHWENSKIPNKSYNDQTTLVCLSEFIDGLNTRYYVIMSDDNTDFFI